MIGPRGRQDDLVGRAFAKTESVQVSSNTFGSSSVGRRKVVVRTFLCAVALYMAFLYLTCYDDETVLHISIL